MWHKGAGEGALHFFGGRDANGQWIPCGGVGPSQVCAGQMESMSFVDGRRAIHGISNDGVPQRCSMPANLVSASRQQGPFHQRSLAMHTPWPRAETFEGGLAWFPVQWKCRHPGCGFPFSRMPRMIDFGETGPMCQQRLLSSLRFREHHGTPRAVVQAVNVPPGVGI